MHKKTSGSIVVFLILYVDDILLIGNCWNPWHHTRSGKIKILSRTPPRIQAIRWNQSGIMCLPQIICETERMRDCRHESETLQIANALYRYPHARTTECASTVFENSLKNWSHYFSVSLYWSEDENFLLRENKYG